MPTNMSKRIKNLAMALLRQKDACHAGCRKPDNRAELLEVALHALPNRKSVIGAPARSVRNEDS